jgi:hypothetical protein
MSTNIFSSDAMQHISMQLDVEGLYAAQCHEKYLLQSEPCFASISN